MKGLTTQASCTESRQLCLQILYCSSSTIPIPPYIKGPKQIPTPSHSFNQTNMRKQGCSKMLLACHEIEKWMQRSSESKCDMLCVLEQLPDITLSAMQSVHDC